MLLIEISPLAYKEKMRFIAKSEGSDFDLLMTAIVLPLLAIDLILAWFVRIDAMGELRTLAGVSIGSVGLWILVAACCYCRWRGITSLGDASQLLAWALLVIPAITFLIPVAGRTPCPLVDGALARIDAGVHFHTADMVRLMSRFPHARRTLVIAYDLLGLLVIAALVVPALAGRARDSRRYILAVLFAAILTAALFALWPAAGPWTVEGFAPSKDQAEVIGALSLLKSGQSLPEGTKSAVVAFPSFHVVLAVLSVIALWNLRWVRWFALTLGTLICISTISTGWHYGIDVIGGLVVTYLAQEGACLLVKPVYSKGDALGALAPDSSSAVLLES